MVKHCCLPLVNDDCAIHLVVRTSKVLRSPLRLSDKLRCVRRAAKIRLPETNGQILPPLSLEKCVVTPRTHCSLDSTCSFPLVSCERTFFLECLQSVGWCSRTEQKSKSPNSFSHRGNKRSTRYPLDTWRMCGLLPLWISINATLCSNMNKRALLLAGGTSGGAKSLG